MALINEELLSYLRRGGVTYSSIVYLCRGEYNESTSGPPQEHRPSMGGVAPRLPALYAGSGRPKGLLQEKVRL